MPSWPPVADLVAINPEPDEGDPDPSFFNNILQYNKSKEDRLQPVSQALEIHWKHQLYAKPSTCAFMSPKWHLKPTHNFHNLMGYLATCHNKLVVEGAIVCKEVAFVNI